MNSSWPNHGNSSSGWASSNRTTSASDRTPSPGRAGQVGAEVVDQLGQQDDELVVDDVGSGHGHARGPRQSRRRPAGRRRLRTTSASVGGMAGLPGGGGDESRRRPTEVDRRANAGQHRVEPGHVGHACGPCGPGLSWLALIGDHPSGRDGADRGLQPDHPVDRGRADDRSVGLGPDGQRREAGGQCRSGARRRAAGAPVQRPRVPYQTAGGRPPAGRALGAHVGPLRQVGAGEHDGPGLPKACDEGGVGRRATDAGRSSPPHPGSPSTSMLSFTMTGTPWSGPRMSPRDVRHRARWRLDERRRRVRRRSGVPTGPVGSSTTAIRVEQCIDHVHTGQRAVGEAPGELVDPEVRDVRRGGVGIGGHPSRVAGRPRRGGLSPIVAPGRLCPHAGTGSGAPDRATRSPRWSTAWTRRSWLSYPPASCCGRSCRVCSNACRSARRSPSWPSGSSSPTGPSARPPQPPLVDDPVARRGDAGPRPLHRRLAGQRPPAPPRRSDSPSACWPSGSR